MRTALPFVLFAIMIITSIFNVAHAAPKCDVKFGQDQIEILQFSRSIGGDDWGYTLAAIAWKESSAGRALVRIEPTGSYKDVSYGIYHNLLRYTAKRAGCSTRSCESKVVQELMTNPVKAAWYAMAELDYWKGRYKGNHMKIWSAYNSGSPTRGVKYARDISKKIKYLRRCVDLVNDPIGYMIYINGYGKLETLAK